MTSVRARVAVLLVLGTSLAACGGGGATSAAPEDPNTPPSTAPAATEAPAGTATVETAEPAGAGTFTITVGGKTGTGVITECTTNPDGSLTATNMGDTSGDVIVVSVGTGTPLISGSVDAIDFALGTDGTATVDGKSGTFGGSDAGTGEAISGTFACP